MADFDRPVNVSVFDAETGQLLQEKIINNDYCLVTVGNRYVKSIQIMGKTHMLAIAVAAPDRSAQGGE